MAGVREKKDKKEIVFDEKALDAIARALVLIAKSIVNKSGFNNENVYAKPKRN